MWTFLRRLLRFFTIGFIVTFIVTLFVQFDADDVILALVIGAAGGVVVALVLFFLERRFPDQPD